MALVHDTVVFLRMASSDKETPEIVRSTAKNLLNSWELQEKSMQEKSKN